MLVALLLLGRSPDFVEQVYARWLSPALCRSLAAATGWLSFSLAEICLLGGTLGAAFLLLRAVLRVARRRVHPLSALRVGILRLLRLALLVAVGFYATWGLNYQRALLPQRLGWAALAAPADRAAQVVELQALCATVVQCANAAYVEAFGTDDLGAVSTFAGSDLDVDRALDAGLDVVARELGLEAAFAGSRGRSKRPWLLAPLMSRAHLSGFFFPWTGEANVNPQPLDCDRLHVVAHEKSHQRGIAREDEAEFVGFLAGAHAAHPYLRYAAYSFAQHVLLRELRALDHKQAERVMAERLPGVQRDIKAVGAFWNHNRGTLTTIAITINDSYLKTHGIPQGVRNYAAAADLLVRYARARGGLDVERGK